MSWGRVRASTEIQHELKDSHAPQQEAASSVDGEQRDRSEPDDIDLLYSAMERSLKAFSLVFALLRV